MSTVTVGVYTLRIKGPDVATYAPENRELVEKTIEDNLKLIQWDAVEGLVNSQLPRGYSCKIEEF